MTGMFGGGVLAVVLKNIWEVAQQHVLSGVTDEVKKKVISTVIDPKTWEDESFFASDLMAASLNLDQKKIIQDGVLFVEKHDLENGTRYAKNFRIILTVRDKVADTADTVRPGINILEEIGTTCKTNEDVFLYMKAIGAMHDPLLTPEKIIHVGKKDVWPFLQSGGKAIAGTLTKAEMAVQKRNEEYRKLSLLKKIFTN